MNKKFNPACPRSAVALACTLGFLAPYAGDVEAQTMAYRPLTHGVNDSSNEIPPGGTRADSNAFLPLVRSLSDRLDTAMQVALSKWDSGHAVCDPTRETQVLEKAAAMAPSYGLTAKDATSIFADQIEANKEIQYALLNGWRREGAAPLTRRDDLSETVRPKLDELQKAIFRNLQALGRLRQSPDCQAQVALAVGQVAQEKSLDALARAALDRSTANICARS